MSRNKLTFTERALCPVCGSAQPEALFHERYDSGRVARFVEDYYGAGAAGCSFSDAAFQLDRCNGCGFVYQRAVLDDESSKFFYESLIDPEPSLKKRLQGTHGYYRGLACSAQLIQGLFPALLPAETRVLDFGMGWGHWLMMAAAHGFDAHGFELCEKRTAYAKSRGLSVLASLDDSPVKYHLINLDQVLEHIGNPAAVIAALVRKLEPNGVLRIYVPNGAFLDWRIKLGRWRIGKNEAQPLEHVNCFSAGTLARLLAPFGLRRAGLSDFAGWRRRVRLLPRYFLSYIEPSWYFRLNG